MNALSLPVLVLAFALGAAAVWAAGIRLSDTTDVLSSRFGLGQALGGVIVLAVVTNLPELAITVTAALRHDLGIAVGNILGGIAVQTVVLVALDAFGVGRAASLTYRAASLTLVLEGALVTAMLAVTVAGTQLPASLLFGRVTPESLLLAVVWIAGVWLIGRARTALPWHENGQPRDGQSRPRGHAEQQKEQAARDAGVSTARTAVVFAAASLVTLAGGVVLEQAGEVIASHLGMSGVLFGATVLAAATSLPELSTGLASIKLGDYQLAVSDIFGGNAFLPVLFLLAEVLSGEAVLPHAAHTDVYLTALGVLLTVVYMIGLIFRPPGQVARMGIDSLVVLVLYALGLVGLAAITPREQRTTDLRNGLHDHAARDHAAPRTSIQRRRAFAMATMAQPLPAKTPRIASTYAATPTYPPAVAGARKGYGYQPTAAPRART